MKRIVTFFLSAVMLCCLAAAQGPAKQNPVKWKAAYQLGSNGQGTITLTADIGKGWHMYDTDLPDAGPVPTTIKFAGEGFKFVGQPKASPAPKKVADEMFGCDLTYWEGKVTFTQNIKRVDKNAKKISISVTYMSCNDANCLPPHTETITLDIK